jgi:hypothetical protein
MHPSVIDASALRFEAFSERNDTPIRMALKPRPQRSVDFGRAYRERAQRIAELACEVVVDQFVNPHTPRIGEHAIRLPGLACAIMQRPKHCLWHAREVGRDAITSPNPISIMAWRLSDLGLTSTNRKADNLFVSATFLVDDMQIFCLEPTRG